MYLLGSCLHLGMALAADHADMGAHHQVSLAEIVASVEVEDLLPSDDQRSGSLYMVHVREAFKGSVATGWVWMWLPPLDGALDEEVRRIIVDPVAEPRHLQPGNRLIIGAEVTEHNGHEVLVPTSYVYGLHQEIVTAYGVVACPAVLVAARPDRRDCQWLAMEGQLWWSNSTGDLVHAWPLEGRVNQLRYAADWLSGRRYNDAARWLVAPVHVPGEPPPQPCESGPYAIDGPRTMTPPTRWESAVPRP